MRLANIEQNVHHYHLTVVTSDISMNLYISQNISINFSRQVSLIFFFNKIEKKKYFFLILMQTNDRNMIEAINLFKIIRINTVNEEEAVKIGPNGSIGLLS